MVDIPQTLIEKLQNRKVVLFVGAGLSIGAGLPSWTNLLQYLIKYVEDNIPNKGNELVVVREAIKDNELLIAADRLFEIMNKNYFSMAMKKNVRDEEISVQNTHYLITQLPFRQILTTNYDVLLESAYQDELRIPVYTQEHNVELAQILSNDERCIIKCHGTIDDVKTIVLTKRDYQKISKNSGYNLFLSALFATKTVLFIGYSLSDPDLNLIMENIFNAFNGGNTAHYALLWRNQIKDYKIQDFHRNHNIQVMVYDEHSEVETFLQQLVDAIPISSLEENSIGSKGQEILDSMLKPELNLSEFEFYEKQLIEIGEDQKKLTYMVCTLTDGCGFTMMIK
ncbi:MAG: SIR2 family protein [Chloroflexota bacterium]